MPAERTSAAQKVTKAEREAKKSAVKQEVSMLLEHLHQAVDVSASRLDMPAADLFKATQLALSKGRKAQPITMWNACVAYARELHPDGSWLDTLLSARPINERIDKTIKRRTHADADALEELRIVEGHYERLRTRQAEARIPATKAQTERGASSQVTYGLNRVQSELDSIHQAFGIEYAVIVTRGMPDSHFKPTVVSSASAHEFFVDKMGTQLTDIALNMEGYALYGTEAKTFKNGKVQDARALVSQALKTQLFEITGNEKAYMPWSKPDMLETRYGVRLVGWPTSGEHAIPFKAMSDMGRRQAEALYALIIAKTLRIEKTTPAEA